MEKEYSKIYQDYLSQQVDIIQNTIDKINKSYDKKNFDIQYENITKMKNNILGAIQALRIQGLSDENTDIERYIQLYKETETARLNLLNQLKAVENVKNKNREKYDFSSFSGHDDVFTKEQKDAFINMISRIKLSKGEIKI